MAIEKTIYVYCEGENTEPYYLRDINKYNKTCMVEPIPIPQPHTTPLPIIKDVIKFLSDKKEDKTIEYWAVFDCDNRVNDVEKAYKEVNNYNKNRGKKPPIKIAMCRPCIEAWALLHFIDPSNNIFNDRNSCQKSLSQFMPKYNHSKGARLDTELMMEQDKGNNYSKYEKAKKHASDWENGYTPDNEYNASKLAGIYNLVDSILNF